MELSYSENFAVQCSNVDYFYPDNTQALNKLNLNIRKYEKVGIIGPNGAGKSTFLTLLNGVRKAKGSIKINNYEVNRKNSTQIKKLVGIVFQNPDEQLFCPTIFEDVAFGPMNLKWDKKRIEQQVNLALKEVDLDHLADKSSLQLSFGQRKLAAIATVLAMDSEIIALDEPTSNLDPKHRRKIINWMKASNQTLLITSHDLDMLLDTCNRILIFNAGKIVADGSCEEILTDEELLLANDLELPLCLAQSKLTPQENRKRQSI